MKNKLIGTSQRLSNLALSRQKFAVIEVEVTQRLFVESRLTPIMGFYHKTLKI